MFGLVKLFRRQRAFDITPAVLQRGLDLNRDYWQVRKVSDGDRAAVCGRPDVRVAEIGG